MSGSSAARATFFERTGYWPLRFVRPASDDGTVLALDAPELLAQVIGVRELAAWIVDAARRRVTGTFNATGPSVPFFRHLAIARAGAGHTRPVIRADPRLLREILPDTLACELSRPPGRNRQAGLSDDDERRLLNALTEA